MDQHNTQSDWLNAAEVARIRLGFARISPNADAFTADFYARLFQIAPTTRALFPDDMSAQSGKLKQVLVMLMAALGHPAELRPTLAALGDRHRSYGVVKSDFMVVGQALLDTVALHLGDRFTPPDRAAWAALYGRIAAIMIAGTAHAAAA